MPDTLFTNARLILDGSRERTGPSDVLMGPEARKSQLREFNVRAGLDTPERIIRSATAAHQVVRQRQTFDGSPRCQFSIQFAGMPYVITLASAVADSLKANEP